MGMSWGIERVRCVGGGYRKLISTDVLVVYRHIYIYIIIYIYVSNCQYVFMSIEAYRVIEP